MEIDKNKLTQAEYLQAVATQLGLTLEGLRLSMRVDTHDFQAWTMPTGVISFKRMPEPIYRLLEVMVELEELKELWEDASMEARASDRD